MRQVHIIWMTCWLFAVIPFTADALLQKALKSIAESGKNNSQCNLALMHTFDAAGKGELWALKILDATTKLTAGQFLAPPAFLGQYDECLSAAESANGVFGKYCLIRGNFSKLEHDITDFLEDAGQPVDIFKIALCIPSACTQNYLEERLNKIFIDIFHFKLGNHSCITKQTQEPLTKLDYTFITVAAILLVLAIASTTYDCVQRFNLKNDKPSPMYSSFSLFTNGRNVLKFDEAGQYGCLNGLKALSMIGIIYGHSAMMMLIGNYANRAEVMLSIDDAKFNTFNNAHNITDTFLVLGSMLLVASFFREIKKKGGYDFPLAVIKRYLRLTPTYALVLLYTMSVKKYHIYGPQYNTLYEAQIAPCFERWPLCLSYTQNYLSPVTKCMGFSWYLDVDMQLFWLSPIFLYPALWWPKITAIIALLASIIAASYEFYNGVYYDLGPVVTFARTFNHFKYDNYLTHTRSAPWFLGIFLGFIFCQIIAKGKKFKMSKMTLWICWSVFGSLFALSQISLYFFGFDYEQPTSALCLAYRRFGWALGVGWMVIACTTNHGGWLNTFLSWGPFSFLSKISYNMYLVHLPIMEILGGQARDFENAAINDTFAAFILYTVISVIIASVLSLFVEMPCATLLSIAFRKVKIFPYPNKGKTKKANETVDENEA